jgi:hypothetical protein
MADVRSYATKVDLINMRPGNCQTYCLQSPGSQYLIYSTTSTFTVTMAAGTYSLEWFNPTTHAVVSSGTVTATSSQSFTAPFSGDAVLWIHQ